MCLFSYPGFYDAAVINFPRGETSAAKEVNEDKETVFRLGLFTFSHKIAVHVWIKLIFHAK